mgnify:CR=1 FL=1
MADKSILFYMTWGFFCYKIYIFKTNRYRQSLKESLYIIFWRPAIWSHIESSCREGKWPADLVSTKPQNWLTVVLFKVNREFKITRHWGHLELSVNLKGNFALLMLTPISQNDFRSLFIYLLQSRPLLLDSFMESIFLNSMLHSQRGKWFAFLTRRSSESLGGNQQSLCCFLPRETDFCVAVHDLHHGQCDVLLHSTFGILLNYAPLSGHHHCGRGSRLDSLVH